MTDKKELMRFGVSYLETICLAHDTNIIVVKNKELENAVKEEWDTLFSYIEEKKETIVESIPKEEKVRIQERSMLDGKDLLQWLRE